MITAPPLRVFLLADVHSGNTLSTGILRLDYSLASRRLFKVAHYRRNLHHWPRVPGQHPRTLSCNLLSFPPARLPHHGLPGPEAGMAGLMRQCADK